MDIMEATIRAMTDPRIAVVVFALCIAGLGAYIATLYFYEQERKSWEMEKKKLLELLRGKEKEKGFTLVELLTVLAIIAVLSAILFPLGKTLQQNVQKHSCISNLQKIYHAVRMYYLDTGTYPERLAEIHGEELADLIDMGLAGVPVDPNYAKSVINKKGIYPIFASELHCPANIEHPDPIKELNGNYYIDPFYFNYAVPDPYLGVWAYQRRRCDELNPYYRGKRALAKKDECTCPQSPYGGEFKKQLYAKEPLSSTVITWCWAHDGKYIVLFLDGHTEVREASEMYIPAVDGSWAPWELEPRR